MPTIRTPFQAYSSPLAGAIIGWVAPAPGQPVQPAQYLARLLDIQTGEINSLVDGLHPVDAIVRFAFSVQEGTGAAVLDVGQDFAALEYNDDFVVAQITAEVHRILDPLVALGWISIETLQVQAGEDQGDTAASFVAYKNLLISDAEERKVYL